MPEEKNLDEIKKFWPKEVSDIENVPKYIKKYVFKFKAAVLGQTASLLSNKNRFTPPYCNNIDKSYNHK